MTYVSDAGLLKMSGCVMTNRMFFAFRIVTRDTPVIGRRPKTAHINAQIHCTCRYVQGGQKVLSENMVVLPSNVIGPTISFSEILAVISLWWNLLIVFAQAFVTTSTADRQIFIILSPHTLHYITLWNTSRPILNRVDWRHGSAGTWRRDLPQTKHANHWSFAGDCRLFCVNI